MVIWLVGLSGAGKSTIGRATYELIKEELPNTVFVDGDEVREVFRHDSHDAYSIDGRRLNSERISALCRWLDRQGINVVCSILSIFEEHRKENRAAFTRYFEVFVDASMEDLLARDYKNLYADANAGLQKNVVGVDIPFAPPAAPDFVVKNGNPPVDAVEVATQIVARSGVLG
jgi:adenylylsulfate kinase